MLGNGLEAGQQWLRHENHWPWPWRAIAGQPACQINGCGIVEQLGLSPARLLSDTWLSRN
jgi:hypothetical protein